MKLTLQTDYALRALMYLGVRTDRLSSIRDIATTYGISEAHMVKVIHRLGLGGFVHTIRGRNGGVRLNRPAEDIRLGAVVRYMEDDMALLACMARQDQSAPQQQPPLCVLMPACRLRGVLGEALEAMVSALDRHTLADVITPFERQRLSGSSPAPGQS